MDNEKNNEVCEACGVAGEMGFIIGAGDETATLTITGADFSTAKSKQAEYLKIAQEINPNVTYEEKFNDDTLTLNVNIHFEVSAEKIIFELKTRHLNQ